MLAIEPVRAADVDPVARLAMRALKERFDPEWLADQAEEAKHSGTFLVARDVPTNHIVGFAVAKRDSAESHLLALAVEHHRRGEGIGSALLSNVRDQAARQGALRLRLEVRADDPGAQEFYQRHGFWPLGVTASVYSDGSDAITMAKPL